MKGVWHQQQTRASIFLILQWLKLKCSNVLLGIKRRVKRRSPWNTILRVLKLYIGSTENEKIHRTYICKWYLIQRKHPLLFFFFFFNYEFPKAFMFVHCQTQHRVAKTLLLSRPIILSVLLDLLNSWGCINLGHSFDGSHTLLRIQLSIIPKLGDCPLSY